MVKGNAISCLMAGDTSQGDLSQYVNYLKSPSGLGFLCPYTLQRDKKFDLDSHCVLQWECKSNRLSNDSEQNMSEASAPALRGAFFVALGRFMLSSISKRQRVRF